MVIRGGLMLYVWLFRVLLHHVRVSAIYRLIVSFVPVVCISCSCRFYLLFRVSCPLQNISSRFQVRNESDARFIALICGGYVRLIEETIATLRQRKPMLFGPAAGGAIGLAMMASV